MEDGEVEGTEVFGDRSHRFAPPVRVMFNGLTVDLDKWLDLAPGEVRPMVLVAERPGGNVNPDWPRPDAVTWPHIRSCALTTTLPRQAFNASQGGEPD